MSLLQALSNEVAEVVEKVGPAVVHVRSIRTRRPGIASGSGAIVSPDGHVLTNSHVVHGSPGIEVELSDGRTVVADLLGDDPATDLALLKIEGAPGHARLADSNALRVGDFAIAVGSPFGLTKTVTMGIVSALGRSLQGRSGRSIEGVIQTDAPINPGNSGGPLLDVAGSIVGINTATVRDGEGLGFAVPSNTASFVMGEILTHGRVRRAFLGIGVQEVLLPVTVSEREGLESPRGVAVLTIEPGGAAAAAGLMPKDVIVSFAARDVATVADLHRLLDGDAIDRHLPIVILRHGRKETRTIEPHELVRRR